MKITGTRGHIIVEFDHRKVKILGELTTTPAFYADIKSFTHWESPFQHVIITESEKEAIIKSVIDETQDKPFKIYFD